MKRLDFKGMKRLPKVQTEKLFLWGGRLLPPLAIVVAGVIVGSVLAGATEFFFRQRLLDSVYQWAVTESRQGAVSTTDPLREGLKAFVEANPFGVDRLAEPDPALAEGSKGEGGESDGPTLREGRLVGTLPPEGAFVTIGERSLVLLRGQIEGGFELVDVESDRAFFRDAQGESLILILEFAKAAPPVTEAPKKEETAPRKMASAPALDLAGRVSAAEPGKEGAVDRELVNSLLMNPFEELRKIRLQPHMEEGAASGIEVRYIRDDSILRQLGVARGDVIQSVNGVQIQNMNDVANAISSLMGGSRFDVSVLRGGSPVELSYTVK